MINNHIVMRNASYLKRKHKFKTINHNKIDQLKLFKKLIKRIGGEESAIINRFGLTYKNKVFLPFNPGDDTRTPTSQMMMIVHECIHVIQWRKVSFFLLRYMFIKSHRALFEAQALHAVMELYFKITGKILEPKDLAERLKYYGLEKKNIKFVIEYLEAVKRTVSKGGVSTPVVTDLIRKGLI